MDNLYVYFSGHGLRLENEKMVTADVLVAADFTSLTTSATTCFTVDGFINALRVKLGAGNHYYFLDACRNLVSKRVTAAEFPFDGNGNGDPGVYMIYSTIPGDTAPIGPAFAKKLKDGVDGKGNAKIWESGEAAEMLVKFESLCKYFNSAHLERFALLPLSDRAVLGLCTDDEWAAVENSPAQTTRIRSVRS